MNYLKHILILACVMISIAACKKDEVEPFDELAQFHIDTTAIRAYVKANNISVIKQEDTGIFYQVTTEGDGEAITLNSSLTATYTGKILNGPEFVTTGSTPETFSLKGAMLGWQAILPLVKKGSTVRMFLPSFYGYGHIANERVPANSVLDFVVSIAKNTN
ncbi:FKBP-type peptidyl-prolyl cis-trans isomerase [Pedobacter deserti]|uniref:FKBP-type peptidyl-prolyl cis-trans isomerase n=1 Tax=Pedobacter deserti TaxID=2817382 RepID=UPI00210DBF98|nr:FKBP-type peptidyl-prolyl cis-trans isomerase [Pedobacter sp. SYSU D00382]